MQAYCSPKEIASSTCLQDEFVWSHEEIPDFNLSFVTHEIQIYNKARQIECQIPSLEIVVEPMPNPTAEEECLLYLKQLDKTHRDADLALAAHKE